MIIFTLLNFGLALYIAVRQGMYWYQVRLFCNWAWLVLATSIIGMCWTVTYGYVIYVSLSDTIKEPLFYTNGLFTLTLGLLVAQIIVGGKRHANPMG